MAPGQIITLCTIVVAAALALIGIFAGACVWFFPDIHAAAMRAFRLPAGSVGPGWAALLIAGASIFGAVTLVKAQQAIANWLAERQLAKLRAAYRDVELALGTEKANQYLAFKMRQIQADSGHRGGVFG